MDGTTYTALGQPGVGFFMAIIVGAFAGWIAEKLTRSDMGLFTNIVMGIIGAVVGNFLPGCSGSTRRLPRQPPLRDRRRRPRHHDLQRRRRPPNEPTGRVVEAAPPFAQRRATP